ncbi:CoA transferase [Brachybacterium phenoliresistens]|uniref:CoA transferase n=1 Tax=Brachybacterium phenoliresistens TaxID=396014 RepID=UPI0031CF8B2A
MPSAPAPLWSGPLDVDGLAQGSVRAAADAVVRLAAARGARIAVTTSPRAVGLAFAAVDHLRIDGEPTHPWAPLSGFFAAADGWVRLHGNYPHHAAAIRGVFDLPDAEGDAQQERQRIAERIGSLPAQEVEDRVVAAGGIAAAVRTPQQWREHPQSRAMAGTPWVGVEPGGPARPLPSLPVAAGGRPLAGLRVLDLTRVIAGPTASQLLGCLGADVLRLDPPHRPELLDAHLSTGMGKRSGLLDLRRDAAVLHEELLPAADVLLLGYRPGALDRFGLEPAALAAAHPGLVVGALSAWGSVGPWGGRAGFDSIVQAATGIAVASAADPARPGALPVQALDHATGFRLAAAVMDLLAQGRGGLVRASLLGAAQELLSAPAADDGPGSPSGIAADGPLGTPAAAGSPSGSTAAPVFAPGPEPVEDDLIEQGTPHGRVRAVPPPLRVDGARVHGHIGRSGGADIRWSQR